MARLVVTRLFVGLAALLTFLFVSFVVIELLIPGDQLTPLRLSMSQFEVDALREQQGFFDPLPVRFWGWLTAFVSGDVLATESRLFSRFGSHSGDLTGPIFSTLFVFMTGLIIAYLVGGWLGRVSEKRGLLSSGITVTGISFYAMFPPFLAFALFYLLSGGLIDLRSAILGGRHELWIDAPITETQVLVRMTVALGVAAVLSALVGAAVRRRWHRRLPFLVTGLVIGLGWYVILTLQGLEPYALDVALRSSLPLLAFVLLAFGEFMLIMQTGMASSHHEDFVLTARAKGLPPRRVRDVHVARGALLLMVTRLAISIPYLLAGLVIIERALGWEGIGSVLFTAIENQDLFVVMSMLAFIGVFVLGARLATEVLEVVLDPRLRRPEKIRVSG